ncbi:chemotaxis protein CheB [Pseudomonas borbori]
MSRSDPRLPATLHRAPAQAVVIGASAGGVHALLMLLAELPANYGLPIVVVLHVPEDRNSELAEVFRLRTALRVKEADNREFLQAGTLYFAAPGYHLSVERDRSFSFSREEPLHYSRPSIDILFESAADVFGAGLVGVLLTGASHDGAAGLASIKRSGGLTVVQNPADAQVPTMPEAALALFEPDLVLALPAIRTLLTELNRRPC